MTFLAPGFLFGALAVAAGIVAMHFLVTSQPRASVLPTARFVPDSPATAIVRDAKPSDLLLMLIRVLLVLAAGAALAKPVIKPARQTVGRVFLLDASRSSANAAEGADSVKRLYRSGDVVIVFDSSARTLGASALESLNAVRQGNVRGNLSAALIASLHGGSAVRDKTDSLELVIVSPLLDDERDAATDSIRKLWQGRARLVRVAPRVDSVASTKSDIDLRSGTDDPLGVAVALAMRQSRGATARLLRGATMSGDDSSWILAKDHALVIWPTIDRPPFAVAVVTASISGGISTGDVRLVAAFSRRWRFPADSLGGARVIARWADGEPAVVERQMGQGCVRSVAIPVTPIGDLVIRPEFVAFVSAVAAPCDEAIPSRHLDAAAIASLGGSGPLARGSSFNAPMDIPSPLTLWLLGIALAAAFGELFVRRTT